ncbi:hypothetical protein ACLQ24_00245 [Micromonospora sp. DT4]|uniref:hypothetical protein n=1 Tax=Micromonospora sp. DT4 TaxID=3393438 RepID=UPI003CF8F9CA
MRRKPQIAYAPAVNGATSHQPGPAPAALSLFHQLAATRPDRRPLRWRPGGLACAAKVNQGSAPLMSPDIKNLDPGQMRALLSSLRLADRHPQPALIWITDGAARARVRAAQVDWVTDGVPACLSALSYTTNAAESGIDAIGVWLPQHHAVQVVDTAMNCHIVSLADSPAMVPEPERVSIAGELRALVGAVLQRPGRLSAHPPAVIADDPALTDQLAHACAARGQHILQILPEHADDVWPLAVKVYVHHSAAAELATAGLFPRADVAIVTAAPYTGLIRRTAAALRTDDVLRWPAAVRHIAASLHLHALAQATARGHRPTRPSPPTRPT